nr:hypothetical protein [Tanacetum cinerariifolium]
MSNSEDSTVTDTKVSSPFEDLSDIGSPGFVVYGYDGLPMHPPSPNYMSGPEHLPSPDYVPGPEHLPLPVYSNPEEDPEEDDEDPEEDLADYPTDKEDDKEEESSEDDADDEEEEDDEDEEEEEHPDPADSIPPPPAEVERLLALPTPTPSPLTPYSSPLPQIPYPPLPDSATYPLRYRATMIQLRAESLSTSHPPPPIVLPHTRESMAMMRAAAPSTYILAPRSETPPSGTPPLLPIPLPTSLPMLRSSANYRADVPDVTLLPRKRLCIALGPRFEVAESSSALTARPTIGTLDAEIRRDPDREIGYGITDIWEDPDEITEEIPTIDVAEFGQRMTDFVTTVRDRRSHACTTRLMKSEARLSRKAWVQSMDSSDMTRADVMSLCTTLLAQQTEITELRKMAPKRTTRSTPATTTTTTTTPLTNSQLKALIDHGVDDSLVTRDADRSQNGEDNHDSGTGVRRQAPPTRECTYPNFMKYKPLYFKGTERDVELTQWFERMETVIRIRNYTVKNQIKFATCTLLGSALT